MDKRILVADSEQNVRDFLYQFLTGLNHQVVIAEDGQDALEKVEMQLFDLYIIDIFVPRLDGLELMTRIREIQPLAVIILTTDSSSIDAAAGALIKGAFHYLVKPLDTIELEKAVEKGLTHSEETEEVGTISPASLEISKELIDLLLLKGFNPDQQKEFQQTGTLVQYIANEKIPLNDQLGAMIWVETGRVSVQYNGIQVDTLRPGDLWGEETFIGSNSVFTDLIVETESQIKHFSRRKLLEYFTYHDESLVKRFMINLIHCLYFKWRKAVIKIGMSPGFSNYDPNSHQS